MRQAEFREWLTDGFNAEPICPMCSGSGEYEFEATPGDVFVCNACDGTGRAPKSESEERGTSGECEACDGEGYIAGGTECPDCKGTGLGLKWKDTGKTFETDCEACGGDGSFGPGKECMMCDGTGRRKHKVKTAATADGEATAVKIVEDEGPPKAESERTLTPSEARDRHPCTKCGASGWVEVKGPDGEPKDEVCSRCHGIGHEPGARFPGVFKAREALETLAKVAKSASEPEEAEAFVREKCGECDGSGIFKKGPRTRDAVACPYCDGEGEVMVPKGASMETDEYRVEAAAPRKKLILITRRCTRCGDRTRIPLGGGPETEPCPVCHEEGEPCTKCGGFGANDEGSSCIYCTGKGTAKAQRKLDRLLKATEGVGRDRLPETLFDLSKPRCTICDGSGEACGTTCIGCVGKGTLAAQKAFERLTTPITRHERKDCKACDGTGGSSEGYGDCKHCKHPLECPICEDGRKALRNACKTCGGTGRVSSGYIAGLKARDAAAKEARRKKRKFVPKEEPMSHTRMEPIAKKAKPLSVKPYARDLAKRAIALGDALKRVRIPPRGRGK